jgi:nucleotide-binding universal stress UspA family protein
MHARKILFGTDFSHLSQEALARATALASESGATLLIAHVEEPPMMYGAGAAYYSSPEVDRAALRRTLEEVVPTDSGVPYEHVLLWGEPAHELAELARREHVDLMVLGTHGRTGMMRLLMGSVAERVVQESPCPVLTIKPAEQMAET